ncbi:MAG: N-acetylglucosamine-6-phosphate deacetylase [Scytolyngbya sp. HA4215-MV1]|nr:N-acetylglucosamine-6-phosphate deacetylase [Scytolyngbya sp. HA4215-MV1]
MLILLNARSPSYQGLQQITVEQGIITAIAPMTHRDRLASSIPTLDLAGDWISLGGIDLQINGALGLPFPELNSDNRDKLPAINEYLWQQGVDGYLPTLVTTSIDNIQRSLSLLSPSTPPPPHSSTPYSSPVGIHLEGPFLNPEKRGAHAAEYLLPLTLDNVKRVLGDHASLVKIMTLAPELDETGRVIPYLKSLGITVSLGHSQATATQAQRAFEQGASMVTHAFNAMPPLHHREPGLLGAAIVHPQVYCGFIADGQHVSPIIIDLLLRASHYERGAFLVSDALSPLGLPDGFYPWDTRQIEVKHGTARLPDGTLSGTTLPLLTGVQNLVNWEICDVESAIALATTAPRQAIGLSTALLHQPANLLRWHWDGQKLSWMRLG